MVATRGARPDRRVGMRSDRSSANEPATELSVTDRRWSQQRPNRKPRIARLQSHVDNPSCEAIIDDTNEHDIVRALASPSSTRWFSPHV